MDQTRERTWAEVDLNALAHNYRALTAMLSPGCRFLGVVKADAYGHGAVPVARRLEELGCGYLAVACLGEAAELRQAGISAPILILGRTPAEETERLLALDLTQTVVDAESAGAFSAAARRAGGRLKVHLKADTGMTRLGWLCAGGIKGLKKARKRLAVRAVCAVGMAPSSPEVVNKLAGQNHLEGLPFFYLRGGYAPEKLPGPYKLMMAPMTKAVTGHPPKDENEAAMQEAFRHGGDWVDEGALAPVLAWLEGS